MKILILVNDVPGVIDSQFAPHLKPESARVWELYQQGIIREIYFNEDHRRAVLILECADAKEARKVISTLPLYKAGLIDFEIIPLVPYNGFARLFGEQKV